MGELTLMDLWNEMGMFAKGIVWTLLIMSIASFSVGLSKWLRFRQMTKATKSFAPSFAEALHQNRIKDAIQLVEEHPKSHVAQVLGESLREVGPLLESRENAAAAVGQVERALEREQILLANDLKFGLGLMATVASTSPFVGLLGTTWGVITAFTGMATEGGGIEAIAAGIAEALITTAFGLIVAITSVWLYNYFTGRVEGLFSELAHAGRELVDFLMLRGEGRTASRAD
jgi:biopolymer transport protein ExbB/biopolymer transport protein TolQ